MTTQTDPVAEAVAAFKRGEIVVVTDDTDRENEGDLIVAAVHATAEKIGFIVRYTTGIVCAPMPRESARRLQLQPMVADNDAPLGTAFTVSVDFRHGMTTGISAEERCNTIRALANANAGAADFVRPGHVFPLIARDGGVLMRSGHTEAAVDLCRLAGLEPVGVLAELVNDDGTVKRGADVVALRRGARAQAGVGGRPDRLAPAQREAGRARRRFRGQPPRPARRTPTPITCLSTPPSTCALVFGDIGDGDERAGAAPPRIGGRRRLRGRQRAQPGRPPAGPRRPRHHRLSARRLGRRGQRRRAHARRRQSRRHQGEPHEEWREVGLGAQILRDLGVKSIRLLASRERHYVGLDGFGIEIETTEIIDR